MRTPVTRLLSGASAGLGVVVSCAACSAPPRLPDAAAAGTVALAYTRALLAGDLTGAASLVADGSRNAFAVLTDGMGRPSLSGTQLAVGRVDAEGPGAVVVLTGTFCDTSRRAPTPRGSGSARGSGRSGASADPGARAAQACVSNRDPGSCDPRFRVELASNRGGPWRVVLGNRESSRFAELPVVGDPANAGGAQACLRP